MATSLPHDDALNRAAVVKILLTMAVLIKTASISGGMSLGGMLLMIGSFGLCVDVAAYFLSTRIYLGPPWRFV